VTSAELKLLEGTGGPSESTGPSSARSRSSEMVCAPRWNADCGGSGDPSPSLLGLLLRLRTARVSAQRISQKADCSRTQQLWSSQPQISTLQLILMKSSRNGGTCLTTPPSRDLH
jgi:hypothetical protein